MAAGAVAWVGQQVFMLAVTYIFSANNKPPSPDPWEQLQFPAAEVGTPIPVVFGTRWVLTSNVVWYGDLKTERVRVGSGGKFF